jgi:hypothetical protein
MAQSLHNSLSSHNSHDSHIRRSVLLWVAVTLALWAALPVAMYLSHWQWFGWMPRIAPPPPAPKTILAPGTHLNPSPLFLTMASLLVMSSVVMAVVLWMVSLRQQGSRVPRD